MAPGSKWSLEQEKEMLQLLHTGKSFAEIGASLERSERGIFCRLRQIAANKIKDGLSLQEACKLTKMEPNYLEEYMNKFVHRRGQNTETADLNPVDSQKVLDDMGNEKPPVRDILTLICGKLDSLSSRIEKLTERLSRNVAV